MRNLAKQSVSANAYRRSNPDQDYRQFQISSPKDRISSPKDRPTV